MAKIRCTVTLAAAALLAAVSPTTWAAVNMAAAKSLMTDSGCFACHAVDTKVMGPAYGWVAYRYKGKPGAVKTLAEKIIHGGSGSWNAWTGGMAMPPHPQLSVAQAEEMAQWVLAQKPIEPPKP